MWSSRFSALSRLVKEEGSSARSIFRSLPPSSGERSKKETNSTHARTYARGACGAKMLPCVAATAATASAAAAALAVARRRQWRVVVCEKVPVSTPASVVCVSLVCAKETALVVNCRVRSSVSVGFSSLPPSRLPLLATPLHNAERRRASSATK